MNLSVNIQLFMLTLCVFPASHVTFCKLNPKNLYISDVRKIILHVVSMWDMEIPPSGQNSRNLFISLCIYFYPHFGRKLILLRNIL
jgi:hypothetical protein